MVGIVFLSFFLFLLLFCFGVFSLSLESIIALLKTSHNSKGSVTLTDQLPTPSKVLCIQLCSIFTLHGDRRWLWFLHVYISVALPCFQSLAEVMDRLLQAGCLNSSFLELPHGKRIFNQRIKTSVWIVIHYHSERGWIPNAWEVIGISIPIIFHDKYTGLICTLHRLNLCKPLTEFSAYIAWFTKIIAIRACTYCPTYRLL